MVPNPNYQIFLQTFLKKLYSRPPNPHQYCVSAQKFFFISLNRRAPTRQLESSTGQKPVFQERTFWLTGGLLEA
jgi:hypothetical protein